MQFDTDRKIDLNELTIFWRNAETTSDWAGAAVCAFQKLHQILGDENFTQLLYPIAFRDT
jgi:hypothetical protein